MTLSRPWFRFLSFFTGLLSLLTLFFAVPAFAKIEQWNFEDKNQYQFDSQKIQIKDKLVRLSASEPYRDHRREDFDKGSYDLNATALRGAVELTPQNIYETSGPEIALPLSPLESGMVALWHFDEPSGTNVLDEASRTVAKTSDTETVSSQMGFGFSRSFDGIKSHVFIPHYQTFKFESALTLELWIRPQLTVNAKPQTLISRWQQAGSQKSFAFQISPEGKLDFVTSPDGSLSKHHPGNTVLAPGVWYHVAAILNGEDIRVYVNGVLDNIPVPYAEGIYPSTNPIYIGSLINNTLDEFFKGAVDEVALYNRGLTETELLTHAGNSRGLVGLWHLNERGGPLSDASGFGQHAIAVEKPDYESEGKIGTAIHFDGKKQHLEIPPSSRFAVNEVLTLQAWVKPEKMPGAGQSRVIISSYPDSQNLQSSALAGEFSLMLSGPDGTLKAIATSVNPVELNGKTALTPNVWQHVAAVWAQGRVQLYINGVPEASASYQGILRSGKSGLRIGMDSKFLSPFSGSIDEVAVYRRARTSEEIALDAGGLHSGGIYTSAIKDAGSDSEWRTFSWKEAIAYGKGFSSEEVGLLHLYHLDEKDQGVFTDIKGNIQASAVGTYSVEGKFSQARWFQTKGLDKIISQKSFPSLSTFTLSFWFQFASERPGLSDRLFSIGDSNPTAFRAGDGRIHISMPGAREIISRSSIQDTQWHSFALAADGRNLFLYIDGALDGNSPFISASAEAPLILGNLKSMDTFQGAIDEIAFFNSPLSREKIYEYFLRGKLGLNFQIRTSNDASFSGVSWRNLRGNPYAEETPQAYTVGLWHLNDLKYFGRPQEVTDASRFSNHGRGYGRLTVLPLGVSNSAITLNGSSDYVQVPDAENLHPSVFTISAWVRPRQIKEDGAVILDKHYQKGAPAFSSYALELLSGNRLNFRIGYSRGYTQVQTDLAGEIAVGKWNHVAATFNGKEAKLYINGKLKKTSSLQEAIVYDSGALYLGRYGASASRFFEGDLDEISIQSKVLEAEEVAQAYEALRPQSLPVTEGKLDIERGRYFQYRALLNTETPLAGPQFQETEIRANVFSTDRPSVSNLKGVSYADISHFSEKLGAGNRGAVSYQLSNDGANWFYHNGRRWVIASGYSESNTADQIQTRIHDFAKEVGIGSFYFKALLHSPTGLEPVELENVEVEYLPNKLTLTSPNGGESWIAGSEHAVTWNSTGEVQKVNLEYSKDDFKSDFHTIAKKISNTGSYTWKVPDDLSTQVKIRVIDGLEPRVYDMSDLSFRLAGSVELIAPNWNEQWEVGSTHEIVWTTNGDIKDVKLELSTDDFVANIYPIIDSVKNSGKFLWKVTDPISSSVKVRVSDVRDPLTFDKSNDTFSIHGTIRIVSPASDSRWIVGSSQEIRWENTGNIGFVRVEYQTSKKEDWAVIADKTVNEKKIAWKVPDDIDGKVKVRITDLNDSKVSVFSPEFSIIGGLRLENPGGGENWTIGSRRKISWQTVGTIPAVNLQYRLASQKDWLPIAQSVANTGSYVWDIPEQPADLLAVRVVDAADSTIEAQSVTPSRIIPTFVLKSPNGGENLKIGSDFNIMWDTRGKVDQVKLEYSQDGFVKDIRTIIGAASNIGRFSWKVPDYAGSKVKVRVSAVDLSSAQDASDGDFRIFPGFKFTAPEGGEKYEVGSLATLVWETTGTVPEVRIEYSHDDFSKDIRVAANSIPNQNRYTWTVPDDIGSGYSFRISDLRDLKAQDFSEGFFSIIGNFRILEPVPGDSYTAGVITAIKWKGAGSVPFVRIDYSEDGFEKTFQTLAEQAPNTGSYDWLVPNLIGREFKIRVWDPSHPDAQDIMSAPAKIIGGFRLLSPNGGEVIYVGDSVDVKWEVLGTIPTVKLEYSQDHFNKNIGEIADAYENTGSYHWQVPDLPTGSYSLRISDPRDRAANDISNSDFKIRSRFTLVSPNGGEGWAVGEKKIISWQTTGSVPSVNLEYSIDDFASVKMIAEKVPNTGTYEWTVPDQVAQTLKVRVSDVKDLDASDASDAAFRIQGVMSLISPLGGDLWKVGEQRAIEWKTAGHIEGVRLEYSHDNFASEIKTIVDSLPNTGTYNWTVPDMISANTKVRVVDLKDMRTQAVSESPFQISASFRLMGPNGGERWHASEKREITWATVGTVKEVNLEYSKDDFNTSVETIDRGVLNTGKFTWELPRDLGEGFKVRVCDADQPKICDVSDGLFSLEPPFEFLAPKGGELWPVGSEQELRWNLYGYVPRVFLQYSTQEPPVEWKTLLAELPNEGHLLFKTPDDISKTVRFRISDFEDADVFTISRNPVQIVGTFQLLTPNGGEKWIATKIQKITWNTLGTAPEVRLEYSNDDFKHDVKLIESSYKNTGSYDWNVPADLAPAVKVRVKDAANDASFDVSDAAFKIIPHFTIVSPNGGEHWTTGDKVQIQWKTEGVLPRIRLDYGTREAGQTAYSWQPLAEVRGNLNHYDWTVPAQVSSDAKIRVYDERDAETTDESDEAFKTLARFKMTTPRLDEVLVIDQSYAIKWETLGEAPSVKLEYAVQNADPNGNIKPVEYKLIENFWSNNGIYYWTVPDNAGESIVFRVSDAREPNAFITGEAFKIRGALKFDMPAGEMRWPVGSHQTLRWKTTGTISHVKLEYSPDGKTWKLIEESVPNSGSYGWLVPDDLSMTARLRVSNVQNAAVFSEFERTINILGEFQFAAPQAAQKWIVGSKETIRWKTTGGIKRVWLDYTVNGKDWMTLAGPVDNVGSYDWIVPDAIATALQLRIKDPDNPAAVALSPNFSVRGNLELVNPGGGEIWGVGASETISWKTTGTIPYVRIEGYWEGSSPVSAQTPVVFGPQLPAASITQQIGSTSTANEWFVISAQEENRGHYDWIIPDKISDQVKIRITDTRDGEVLSVQKQPLSIIGELRILNPNGTEIWTVGDQQQIVWTSQGTIPEVLLEYSRDDFYRDVNTIASGVPNTGAALWVIPDSISDQVKVRVSDLRDKRAFNLTNPFRIKGKLDFITPVKDEVIKVASKHILHWKTTGSIPQVRIEYSRDDFRQDVQVIENSLGNQDSYEWQIPDIVSSTVKLRIMDLRDNGVFALSSPFKVEAALTLKSPLGGEQLQALSPVNILWDTIGTVEKVRLEYSRDDFNQDVHAIIPELPNQGSYEWIIPDDIGMGIKVRVLNAANFSVSSMSPDPFSIHGALSFTVSPEKTRWTVGSKQVLSWQALGTIPHVKLEYSKDDFQKDIQVIAETLSNENKYDWVIPDDISSNVRLRVSDVRDANVFAVTAFPAAVVGQLKFLQPTVGSVLKVAEDAVVKWETVGSIPGVRLEFQTIIGEAAVKEDGWNLITGLSENKGEFLWKVPNAIAPKARLRISDARDMKTADLSPEFSVVGKLNLLAPAGGERWIVGTSHELLWQSVGTITEINLQYSTDGFVKDIREIASKISNSGRLLWTVPDSISNQIQIRIQDSKMREVVSHTSAPISIVGDFVLAVPSAPVTWKVGSEVRLEWQTIGTIPQVKLEYLSSKQSDARVIQDGVPNQGYYSFHTPDWIGEGGQIKISDGRDAQVSQLSPAIKIEGELAFEKPLKGDTWNVGQDQVFEWRTIGSIPSVVLESSSDHFQRDVNEVQTLLENKNRFLWTVPDAVGVLMFRVRDSRDDKVYALSDEVKVRSVLQLLSPKTQDALTVGSRREIVWKAFGTVPQVRLEYSSDGFQKDRHVIAEKIETSRLLTKEGVYSYLWDVPDFISEKVQIRVSDIRDESTAVLSEPFKIKGAFKVLAPQGKEQWTALSHHDLLWETTGTIPFVRLEYSRDGFKKDVQLISAHAENNGRYAWTVADAVHSGIWIRISDERDLSVSAVHSEPVEVHGALKWTSPRGGETWRVGESVKLEWSNTGSIPEVNLEYLPEVSEEQKVEPVLIAARVPNQGSFNWELPGVLPHHIKLRITDSVDSGVSDTTTVSNLILGVLKLTSPDANVVWPIGSTQEIVWQSLGHIPQVKVEASRDHFQKDIQTLFPLLPNTGSVKWTVGDLISKDFQVRISDVQNPQVATVNAEPIEIMGGFRVLTPEAGAILEVGAKEEIAWQTTGTIAEVRIEYSSDRFNHPSVIAEKVANTGRFQWQVPDTVGDHYQIRISDVQHPEMSALSETPFSIQGRLVLKSPQGGEIWRVASDVDISWETIGTVPQVSLEYSMDDFVHAIPIVQNLSNSGRFKWRIPDIVSEKVKVRVVDSKHSQVFSSSVQPLKIQGALTVLAPQAGEFWEMGTQHTILWQTTGSIPFVTIEYSSDNFATSIPVILGVANAGRYQWTVPDLDSETLKFRISDAHDGSVFSLSSAFEVGGTLKVLSPQGGETWAVGEDALIKWQTGGTIPRVRLELSTDEFQNNIQTLESSFANNGSYSFKVPDQIGANYKVRVTDANNPRITDASKGVFKIGGVLSITAPRGGEKWAVGSTQTIEWQNRGTIPAIRIEYTKDNFADTIPISTNVKNTGRFTWEIPDLAGEKIQLRISDAMDPSISASMIADVEIKPVLSLTSPKGGEVWKAQESQPISWKTTGTMPFVNLEYSVDGFNETKSIASQIANTGSFLWTLPDISARRLSLRVVSSTDTSVFSELITPVQIQGEINVTNPVGGEILLVGSNHPITWVSKGSINRVRLEYSTDGFRTSFPIAVSLANDGHYDWIIPDAISKEGRIRVVHDSESGIFGQNDKPFEIRGALNLLTGVGGESWVAGSRHPISWQSTGTIPHVRLEYSTDGFVSDVQTIVPVLDNKGVYYWEVPAVSAPGIKIRVLDPNHPDVFDVSKSNVILQGELQLLSPAGGETYQVGERAEVLWRATPNIANVKLEYSLDNFESTKVISDYIPNTGKFVWNIPNQISDQWRLRVSDAVNQTVFSFSKFPFTTHGALEMISPKGGELWPAGSKQTLSWNTLGAIPKIRIEYSSDNFQSSLPIVTSTENTGSYLWTVPEIPYPEIRLRVTAAETPSIFSASQGAVNVVGKLNFVTPAAGERWVVGEEKVIRWQTAGYMPQVDLEYSKDNFIKDVHLIGSKIPNVGSFSWTVPNDPSNEMRLRVRNSENNKISAISETPFKVNYFQIRWMVKDAENNDHLGGLVMTDSTGKTISRGTSPANFEYPYGIYTTVWTKPGYAEHRSTWLADRDQAFEVLLEPQKEKIEMVRASFEYDRQKDFMNIAAWYEKDAKIIPAVIQAEVKIYKNKELLKALTSTTPDASGAFHLMWDTTLLEGNEKYFASVAVTTAAGQTLTSPLSYQLDIPVKEKKEPEVRHAITSMFLRPLGLAPSSDLPKKTSLPASLDTQRPKSSASGEQNQSSVLESDSHITETSFSTNTSNKISPIKNSEEGAGTSALPSLSEFKASSSQSQLIVPKSAVMHETVSITYVSTAGVHPVLDMYDSNRKLVLRAQEMKPTEMPGTYAYLIPVKGLHFIPGKTVRFSVIELATGKFKSAEMSIISSPAALGYEKQAGERSVLEILQSLDLALREIRRTDSAGRDFSNVLKTLNNTITNLAGLLSEESLDPKIFKKFNEVAEELAAFAQRKGYSGGFVAANPLNENSSLNEVNSKMRDLKSLIQSLQRLYDYAPSGA